MKEAGYVVFGIYVLLTAWLLLSSFLQWRLWRHARKNKNKIPRLLSMGELPFVSIQVPVYNERYVVEGLLDALSCLNYPRQLYEVLVLDDSTDETTQLIQQKAEVLRSNGLDVRIIRRKNRNGYKAGALQESLSICKGSLIAIFDADFRPAPDFLSSLLPNFTDPAVGLVQARWTHLNPDQNFLTRIQSYLLDTYFAVEQAGRQAAGYFTNFCGTAGIWRRQCIEEAGGWDGTILSEDLDLSYRAQLKGWKVVYDAETTVPAELPADVEAFKIQQARWTKGIVQTFRKNGKAVASADMRFSKKVHAFFHLLSSFVFPCLFINSVLAVPLLFLRQAYPEFILLTNAAAIGGLNLILLTAVFYQGVKVTGNNGQFFRYYPVFLLVYMGLSVQNTIAVLQGLFGHRSAFVRTPKYAHNKASATAYFSPHKNGSFVFELLMLLYFLGGISISLYLNDWFFMLLFLMMACGIGIIVFHSLQVLKIRWPSLVPKLRWRRLFLFKYE